MQGFMKDVDFKYVFVLAWIGAVALILTVISAVLAFSYVMALGILSLM